MNKLVKDALVLTAIALIAGVCLGGVYEITKDPIAKAQESATQESYKAVFADAASFEDLEGFDADAATRSLLMQVIQMMILQIAWLQKMMQGRRSVMSSRSHLMPDMAETSHSLWV